MMDLLRHLFKLVVFFGGLLCIVGAGRASAEGSLAQAENLVGDIHDWNTLPIHSSVQDIRQPKLALDMPLGHRRPLPFSLENEQLNEESESLERHDCPQRRLGMALTSNLHFRQLMEAKHLTGNMEGAEVFEQHLKDIQSRDAYHAVEVMFDKLYSLSAKHRTSLLIYSQPENTRCVWLVDSTGILGSAQLKITHDWAPSRIWADFAVEARGNRSPAKRSSDECIPDTPNADMTISDQRLELESRALAFVAHDLLPDPIANALSGSHKDERLLILSSGNIAKTPFAALPLKDGSIIDHYAVIILPSIDAIGVGMEKETSERQLMSKKSPSNLSMVVADPDMTADKAFCWPPLPYALSEGKYAASRFQDKNPFFGVQASLKNVTQHISQNANRLSLIYFASHANADPDNPADQSYIALSGNYLTGRIIQAFRLQNNPLVVMSACETGLGKTFDGGIYGLADAWWYAGARQVVMSLWDVSDSATSRLMRGFADQLVDPSKPADSQPVGAEFALAYAIRTFKAAEADPALWSSFTIYGRPSGD